MNLQSIRLLRLHLKFSWLLFVLTALMPLDALAKRAGPAPVVPVEDGGIRYSAPPDNGRKAIIRAADAATGKALWEVTVYEVTIDPKLEEDVQWVFIKSIKLDKGSLRITDETGRVFLLDLKTRRVTPEGKPSGKQRLKACLSSAKTRRKYPSICKAFGPIQKPPDFPAVTFPSVCSVPDCWAASRNSCSTAAATRP